MKTPECIVLDPLFGENNGLIEVLEHDEMLISEFLKELQIIRQRVVKMQERKLIEYYKAQTGISDISDLSMTEMMRLGAFLTLVKHCPEARALIPAFDVTGDKKCPGEK